MVNLRELDLAEMNDNSTGDRSKKQKWYNKVRDTLKLMSPQSLILSGSESNWDEKKGKSMKNFFRRKKTAVHDSVKCDIFFC